MPNIKDYNWNNLPKELIDEVKLLIELEYGKQLGQEKITRDIIVRCFDYIIDEKIKVYTKTKVRETIQLAIDNVKLTDFAQEFLQEGADNAIDKKSIANIYDLIKFE